MQPILKRSCIACHTSKDNREPAGKLDLDADDQLVNVENYGKLPGTYVRLAADERAKFGHKPVGYDSWGYPQASRYIRMMQSRRSVLVWKIFGKRLDGFSNDDHPSEPKPGAGTFALRGKPVDIDKNRSRYDIDFTGSIMPPPEAVAGTYVGPDGKKIKVEPLSDEDRRTLVRWIDLGCPLDLDYDAQQPSRRGYGWMCDDNRPVLTLVSPTAGANARLDKIVVGMHDYYTGIAPESFTITADFAIDGVPPGTNLAPRFKSTSQGVWQWQLAKPIEKLPRGEMTVSVKDRAGNVTRIEWQFSVSATH